MTDNQVIGIMAAILMAPILRQAATGDGECISAVRNGNAIKDCAGEARALFEKVSEETKAASTIHKQNKILHSAGVPIPRVDAYSTKTVPMPELKK